MSNLDSFHERLRQVEKIRRKEEAKDPRVRKSPRVRRQRLVRRARIYAPILTVALALASLYIPKVFLMQHLGPHAYTARVDFLMQGDPGDLIVGIVMTPDVITKTLYEKSRPLFQPDLW